MAIATRWLQATGTEGIGQIALQMRATLITNLKVRRSDKPKLETLRLMLRFYSK